MTTLGVAAVLVPYALLRVQREAGLFDADMRRDHAAIAHALRAAAVSVSRRGGLEAVAALLADADLETDRAQIRWRYGAPEEDEADDAALATGFAPGIVSADRVSERGERELVTRADVKLGALGAGQIEIHESLGEREAYLKETLIRALSVTALLIALCFAVISAAGWLLLNRPLRPLLDKLARVGSGDLGGPLPIRSRDELGLLASALNEMCEQLQALQEQSSRATEARIAALEQLRHANRLSTVGTLASGIAHELGTPLNVIAGRGKMIARGQVIGEAVQADAQVIVQQAERMTAIIRQLLDFVRHRSPRRHTEDVHALCAQTLALLQPLATKSGVRLELSDAVGDARLEVDAAQLQQVLTNLVMNAVQAQPKGGAVRLEVHESPTRQGAAASTGAGAGADAVTGRELCIRVQDEGCGMNDEVRERLFEPFFTTKDVGAGTGLGLSVAYGIVADHGGRIEVESREGQGSCFSVHLPQVAS